MQFNSQIKLPTAVQNSGSPIPQAITGLKRRKTNINGDPNIESAQTQATQAASKIQKSTSSRKQGRNNIADGIE